MPAYIPTMEPTLGFEDDWVEQGYDIRIDGEYVNFVSGVSLKDS